MHALLANLHNETQKIFLKKKTTFFIILSLAITILTVVLVSLFQNKTGIFAFNTASIPLILLGLFTNIILPLFIFSLASEIFAGEAGDNTLKLTLTRPISRFKVYLSKLISLVIFVAMLLALILVISLLTGFLLNGLQLSGLFQAFFAFFIAIFPMLVICIFAVFVAQFFKNSSSAIITCVFVYLAAKLLPYLPYFTAKIAKASLFNYTDWHKLWLANTSVINLTTISLLLVAYSMIFFAAGYYFFDKRDY